MKQLWYHVPALCDRLPEWSRVAVVAAIIFGVIGCGAPCETTWRSAPARSPDGQWEAIVHEEMCDRGLFSEFGRSVELLREGTARRTRVLTPEGEWDAGNEVILRWRASRVLEVSVPNRTVLIYSVHEHEGVEIRVVYRDNDPDDRQRWLAAREQRRRWLREERKQGKPEPEMPSPPVDRH